MSEEEDLTNPLVDIAAAMRDVREAADREIWNALAARDLTEARMGDLERRTAQQEETIDSLRRTVQQAENRDWRRARILLRAARNLITPPLLPEPKVEGVSVILTREFRQTIAELGQPLANDYLEMGRAKDIWDYLLGIIKAAHPAEEKDNFWINIRKNKDPDSDISIFTMVIAKKQFLLFFRSAKDNEKYCLPVHEIVWTGNYESDNFYRSLNENFLILNGAARNAFVPIIALDKSLVPEKLATLDESALRKKTVFDNPEIVVGAFGKYILPHMHGTPGIKVHQALARHAPS
jgi:uncharacterized coiled-coil protein SlyX